MKEKLVIILGPTASGKTNLSIIVAKQIKGEIISGDSMQVYRKMDIGTAKITLEERQGIIHHLLDIRDPDQPYSVADFQQMARQLITDINSRGKIPIIVGGTGLYISSVIDPYIFTDNSSQDSEFRQRLKKLYASGQAEILYKRLQEIDPLAAAKIHPNDSHRLIRALEVYKKTGRPISQIQQESQNLPKPDYILVMIGLTMNRHKLYQRIDQRVDMMLEAGLEKEVLDLLEAGYTLNNQSMQGLGYRQIADYLLSNVNKETAIHNLKRDTRRYAKRQLTWFKRDERIKWFDIDCYSDLADVAKDVIYEIRRVIGED
ncbi:MAG: tRNA (adenosine(37)-N6)-dimethylallyltransferase MiaA [Bacillota bacterium]